MWIEIGNSALFSSGVLVLLLVLLRHWSSLFLEVNDEFLVVRFWIPLKSFEIRQVYLVILLLWVVSLVDQVEDKYELLTFFFSGLWIASSASRMVTPFRFRAVTMMPVGNWRSILLIKGVVRGFLTSTWSIVPGDVLIFLMCVSSLGTNEGQEE